MGRKWNINRKCGNGSFFSCPIRGKKKTTSRPRALQVDKSEVCGARWGYRRLLSRIIRAARIALNSCVTSGMAAYAISTITSAVETEIAKLFAVYRTRTWAVYMSASERGGERKALERSSPVPTPRSGQLTHTASQYEREPLTSRLVKPNYIGSDRVSAAQISFMRHENFFYTFPLLTHAHNLLQSRNISDRAHKCFWFWRNSQVRNLYSLTLYDFCPPFPPPLLQ